MSDYAIATVRKFLIEGQGLPEAKVTAHARILQDLGVDGGDAREVFQALHAQFGTDFTELNSQWLLFFNTEGASPRALLFGIPAIAMCSGIAGVLGGVLHWPKAISVVLGLSLIAGGGRLLSCWFGRELHPLTVNGLAEIVRTGRWPADPADVR